MKKAERKRAREILSSLSQEQIEKLSKDVSKNIVLLLSDIISENSLLIGHSVIGAYVPIQSEPIWFGQFNLNFKHNIALPHVLDEATMQYYERSMDEVSSNKLDFQLKLKEKDQAIVPDILLIPGLAFTKTGKRLGRGKGYFDRYLANFKGIKIGVAYECQMFSDLSQDEFDIKMNFLVTEKNIYKGKDK